MPSALQSALRLELVTGILFTHGIFDTFYFEKSQDFMPDGEKKNLSVCQESCSSAVIFVMDEQILLAHLFILYRRAFYVGTAICSLNCDSA